MPKGQDKDADGDATDSEEESEPEADEEVLDDAVVFLAEERTKEPQLAQAQQRQGSMHESFEAEESGSDYEEAEQRKLASAWSKLEGGDGAEGYKRAEAGEEHDADQAFDSTPTLFNVLVNPRAFDGIEQHDWENDIQFEVEGDTTESEKLETARERIKKLEPGMCPLDRISVQSTVNCHYAPFKFECCLLTWTPSSHMQVARASARRQRQQRQR